MTAPVDPLILECRKAEEGCLYTSLSFFIWLRILRVTRIFLNVAAVVCGALAGWKALSHEYEMAMAVFAVLAAILPQVQRVTGMDLAIKQLANLAGEFKNLQDRFRRAASVSSSLPFEDFSSETTELFNRLEKARAPSITPPEFCFWLARRKIRKGHYDFDCSSSQT